MLVCEPISGERRVVSAWMTDASACAILTEGAAEAGPKALLELRTQLGALGQGVSAAQAPQERPDVQALSHRHGPTQTSLLSRLPSPVQPPPEVRAELVGLLAAVLLSAAKKVGEVGDETRCTARVDARSRCGGVCPSGMVVRLGQFLA